MKPACASFAAAQSHCCWEIFLAENPHMRAQGVTDITLGLIIFRWYPTMFMPWIGCDRQKYILIAAWLFAVPYGSRRKGRWKKEKLSGTAIEEGAQVTANEFATWMTMRLESGVESGSDWFDSTQRACNLWNLVWSSQPFCCLWFLLPYLQSCEDDYCLSLLSLIETAMLIRTSSYFKSSFSVASKMLQRE